MKSTCLSITPLKQVENQVSESNVANEAKTTTDLSNTGPSLPLQAAWPGKSGRLVAPLQSRLVVVVVAVVEVGLVVVAAISSMFSSSSFSSVVDYGSKRQAHRLPGPKQTQKTQTMATFRRLLNHRPEQPSTSFFFWDSKKTHAPKNGLKISRCLKCQRQA